MAHTHQIVRPGRSEGTVLSESGKSLATPDNWDFLAAGDAAITRSVKAKGPTWVVQVKMGRRLIAKGIWADKADILAAQEEVTAMRATPAYARKRSNDLARRQAKHKAYEKEFFNEVLSFLAFHERYRPEAQLLAEKITSHATPVGSGTVARTTRIPVAKRAEAAVKIGRAHV